MLKRLRRASILAILSSLISQSQAAEVPGARLEPVSFSALRGWAEDDHLAALKVFAQSCTKLPVKWPALCSHVKQAQTSEQARLFFEKNFQPYRVVPQVNQAFFTGYFEPDVSGSLQKTAAHSAPLLALPDDVMTLNPRLRRRFNLPENLTMARRENGRLVPYHTRADIEDGALGEKARVLVWLDPIDLFFVHIQGSARIRLENNTALRVGFAGRNGHPYTAIGKILIDQGVFAPKDVTMAALKAWLHANPAEGCALMRKNLSYIFFRIEQQNGAGTGPHGAAGVPLTPGRSLAVDAKIWPYGLPIWVDAQLPLQNETALQNFSHLLIAQDTGAAIVGPARGDIFFGSGDGAGEVAGRIRHAGEFIVLLPRGEK